MNKLWKENSFSSYSAVLPLSFSVELGCLLVDPDQCSNTLASHFSSLFKQTSTNFAVYFLLQNFPELF